MEIRSLNESQSTIIESTDSSHSLKEDDYENVRLISIERLYLGRPLNYVVFVGQVNGLIERNDLNTALIALKKIHALLHVRIKIEDSGNAWFERIPYNNFDIQVVSNISDLTWQKIAEREHMRYFDIFKGPLIRFTLLQSNNTTELIICAHHAICDGISLSYLLRDLLLAINNPDDLDHSRLSRPFVPVIDSKNIPNRLFSPLKLKLIQFLNQKWQKQNFKITPENLNELHHRYWKKYSGVGVLQCQFSQEKTSLLINACRNHKITIHSALVTALIIAQAELQNKNESSLNYFHMPVNIRNRLLIPISNEDLAFFASTIIFNHKAISKSDTKFWEIASKIHQIIQKGLKSPTLFRLFGLMYLEPTLIDASYYQLFHMIDHKIIKILIKIMGIGKIVAGCSLTNIGVVDIPRQYGKFTLNAIFGPSVFSEILQKIFSACTFDGQMNLTITFEKSQFSEKTAEHMRDRAIQILLTHI